MKNPSTHAPFWISLAILLVGVLSPLFGSHAFRNLEPYPDGLMYVVPPLNYLETGNWALEYNDQKILPNVPPLYSWLLLSVMFFWRSPDAFVFLNAILMAGALFFLYRAIDDDDKPQNPILMLIILSFFSLNPVIWWYSGLPMSENLGLFLASASIFFIISKKQQNSHLWTAIIACGFLLTKYTYYPMGLVLAIYSLVKPFFQKNYTELAKVFAILVLGLLLAVATQVQQQSGPFYGYYSKIMTPGLTTSEAPNLESTGQEIQFFSWDYLNRNFTFYVNSLIGMPVQFLWAKKVMIPTILVLLAFSSFQTLIPKEKAKILTIIALWLAQFGLLMNFYVQDQRYSMLNIVFIIFFAGSIYAKKKLANDRQIPGFVLIMIILVGQLLYFLYGARDVITANIFHRSESWQYQAVKHFEELEFLNENAVLITALPPFLLTSYSEPQYQIMPLSRHQEFLAKGQNVWHPQITDSQNLQGLYREWLEEGKEIYISQAYISHQQAVIDDFDELARHFYMVQVSEGCNKSCNVFKLLQ